MLAAATLTEAIVGRGRPKQRIINVKAIFIVYFFVGMFIGGFLEEPSSKITSMDRLVVAGIHIPLLLLAALGIWHGRRKGTFLGMSPGAFVIAAVVSYCAGIAVYRFT